MLPIFVHIAAHIGMSYLLTDVVGWRRALVIGGLYKGLEWWIHGCTLQSFIISMVFNVIGVVYCVYRRGQ